MRICHVVSRVRGGIATALHHLTVQQLEAGHQVACIYGSRYETEDDIRLEIPEPARIVPWMVDREISLRNDWRALSELVDQLREIAPDVVHLHSSKAGALGRLACRRLGLPNVYSPCSISYLRRDVGSLTKAAYMGIEGALALVGGPVVACSPGEYTALRHLPSRTLMVPNQVDVGKIDHMAHGAAGVGERFRIVICGRLEPQKNPELIARLMRRAPVEWEWVWVGDGPYEKAFTAFSGMVVTGWVSRQEALRQMYGADVVLHASSWEGMPFAILEAMALRKAVVTTNIEGNRDLVADSKTGYICETEQQILDRLMFLSEHRDIARDMGEEGRRKVLAENNTRIIGKAWEDLYGSLIAG